MKTVHNYVKTVVFFLILVSAGLSAQSSDSIVDLSQVDISTVDFSEARLSVAGPGAFLIRSVKLDGKSYSVIFKEIDGSWVFAELTPESDSPLLPPNVVLDFATISLTDSGLRIDGIIVDGKTYSTTLAISGDSIGVPTTLSAGKLVGASLIRVNSDAGLYTSSDLETAAEEGTDLSQRNTELVSQVGDLSSQLSDLQDQNDQMAGQMEQLKKEKESLDQEVASLQDQLAQLTAVANSSSTDSGTTDSADKAGTESAAGDSGDAAAVQSDSASTAAADSSTGTKDNGSDTAAASAEMATDSAAAAADTSSDAVSSTDAEEQNKLLQQRIGVLLDKIALLEDQITKLEAQVADANSNAAASATATPAADSATYIVRIQDLESQISDLRIENAKLSAERNEIEQEVRSRLLKEGVIATILPELTEVRQKGFSMSAEQIGNWQQHNGVMEQTDPNQFFAKLELPMPQDNRPTLYKFEARSRGEGWVGFGIHIFADNVEKKGYGYGESLLIWFTRDPREYGTNRTYLEIYRSRDDINMARVLNAALPEDISEWMDIEVLYQPGDEYITVAVDGEEKVRYKTWFGIDWGVGMALRTLDNAEFRNLEVLSTPGAIDWPE